MIKRLNLGAMLRKTGEAYFQLIGTLIVASAVIHLPLAAIAYFAPRANWVSSILTFLGLFLLSAVATFALKDLNPSESRMSPRPILETLKSAIPLLMASTLYTVSMGGLLLVGVAAVLVADFIGLPVFIATLVGVGLLSTRWSLVAPVVAMEKPDTFDAFGRSGNLVKGNGWQVFAVLVLVALAVGIVAAVVSGVGYAFSDVGGEVVGPFIASSVLIPFLAVAAAVMYFELLEFHPVPERLEREVYDLPPSNY